jgi:putative SOS response-associated peptidase YedK
MCGRFVSTSPPDEIAKYFDAEPPAEETIEPSFNVAPTNDVWAVLVAEGERKVEALRWGLVPFWAKNLAAGAKMINARAETVAEKNAYKRAFLKRRCIIPADGFYEWAKVPEEKRKQPMFIHRPDGEMYAFAGLYEVWRNPDTPGEEVHSCTILTGAANDAMAKIHDRMPIMLPPSEWQTWLDPEMNDVEQLQKLLVAAPVSLISMHPVSTDVNNVRNKSEHLIDPADPVVPLDALGLDD